MLRKTMIILAAALALGGTAVSTTAFARGGGGSNHGGGGFSHDGGGDHHFGGGFHDRHAGRFFGDDTFGFLPYEPYAYDPSCYQTTRYHTPTGWHTRQTYVCY
jgi:hypothetical protein